MKFRTEYIYHIYNQGNNKRLIFHSHANYMYFMRKTTIYVSPFADFLAYCLMPSHFHFMVYVNMINRSVLDNGTVRIQNINDSIGIMLRSYTRAINNQEGSSGSLFRKETKAICVNCQDKISPSWVVSNYITKLKIQAPENQYPKICFDYIHENPVKSGLVFRDSEWKYSSAKAYKTNINDYLVDKKLADEYVLI